LRLQVTRTLVLVVVLASRLALADGDGSGDGSAAPSTNGPPGETEPSSDDYRDPFDPNATPAPSDPADAPASASDEDPITGTVRLGVYTDSDKTTVWRALGTVGKTFGKWSLSGSFAVDAVTSASIDVRTSPALGAVDVITSASGISSTSGGQMSDTRYQGTTTVGWQDSDGHVASSTVAVASERDYASVSGGLTGSYDILRRSTTLLAGINAADNWVSSVLDPTLHRKMFTVGGSLGVARVLTRDDAIRLRYDGKIAEGYQASPYRSVRFGDWTTTTGDYGQIMFAHTIGDAAGLAEKLPGSRLSHALTLEWVHSLTDGIGLHPSVRAGYDSWGIASLAPALELRIAKANWRLQLGYRFYLQSHARFFEGKYTQDPSMYAYYTSDKELGSQVGHVVDAQLTTAITAHERTNDTRTMLFIRATVFRYAYPGFELLQNRSSAFFEAGLLWEL
jgi:hypothetical protein